MFFFFNPMINIFSIEISIPSIDLFLNLIFFLFVYRIVLFAGDVSPIEIMCHLPAVCEEKSVPYAYVPSRHELGAAMGVKRGTVTVLVREHPEYKDLYDELKKEIGVLPVPW